MTASPPDARPAVAKPGKMPGSGLLRLIGIFKLLKGIFLIAAAISVFHLINKDIADVIYEWTRRLHIAPGNPLVEKLVERMLTVSNKQLVVVGFVLLAYATMFLIEGVGLLLLQHWAEWMTVITTSGLIPFEIYEMVRHPTITKAVAMVVNVVLAVYLYFHVRRENAERRKESQGGEQSGSGRGGEKALPSAAGSSARVTPTQT
jgi:uncharacterized membrane protein (DUF2068 family)